MAHMVETMAYSGEVPWHGLGKRVPADLSPEQMLESAGLKWDVVKYPIFAHTADDTVKVENKQALIRSDNGKILSVVGADWKPFQNKDAFAFFNDFVAEGDMEMHTAGSLDEGRRVWALAKVNDALEVFKDDVVEQYLLFSNPHRYGQSIDVRMTPIRVVCNNTLSMSLSQQSNRMVQVSHKREFDADLVKETLGVAAEKLQAYKEAATFLGSKLAKDEDVIEYMNRVFGQKNYKKVLDVKKGEKFVTRRAQNAYDVIKTQPGHQFGEGTWWQPFNAVTYMTDHQLGRSDDSRINSAWYGGNASAKTKALELAIEYAEAA